MTDADNLNKTFNDQIRNEKYRGITYFNSRFDWSESQLDWLIKISPAATGTVPTYTGIVKIAVLSILKAVGDRVAKGINVGLPGPVLLNDKAPSIPITIWISAELDIEELILAISLANIKLPDSGIILTVFAIYH